MRTLLSDQNFTLNKFILYSISFWSFKSIENILTINYLDSIILQDLQSSSKSFHFNWVHDHIGVLGNEKSNHLTNETTWTRLAFNSSKFTVDFFPSTILPQAYHQICYSTEKTSRSGLCSYRLLHTLLWGVRVISHIVSKCS